MPFAATVLRVMIASPSDVTDARDAVEKAIYGWNDANAKVKGVILQPWRWETSTVPVMGGHPQKLINAQGVDDSDIVFALFGGRLGSPTPDAVSGTVEEVDRAVEVGKPVHMYFSTASLPHDVDTAQLDALRTFQKDMQERGLLGEFTNVEQLSHEVWKAIEHDITTIAVATSSAEHVATSGVDFLVQPGEEREAFGFGTNGASKYRTKHWIDVTEHWRSRCRERDIRGGVGCLHASRCTGLPHDCSQRTAPAPTCPVYRHRIGWCRASHSLDRGRAR